MNRTSVRTLRVGLGVALTAAMTTAVTGGTPALAAPPDNDTVAGARVLSLPASVTGTLVDATIESRQDRSRCGDSAASVWYRFTAPRSGDVVLQVDNAGSMDGTVDVMVKERSRLRSVDCAASDGQGRATLHTASLSPGSEYLIRVGRDEGSVADTFRLDVLVPAPLPRPPGRTMSKPRVKGELDQVERPGDVWNRRLSAGKPYRFAVSSQTCVSMSVFPPGARSFDSPVASAGCGGYRLFTPEETGRFVILLQAQRIRGAQPYRLAVRDAGRDDTAPGIPIGARGQVRGHVNGGIDSVDLYRFSVSDRSKVRLGLHGSGNVSLTLSRDGGGTVDSGTTVSSELRRGQYYVFVSGKGNYRLSKQSRLVTHTKTTFDGKRQRTVRPGEEATVGMRVRPRVSGSAWILMQRWDPQVGWQFLQRREVSVQAGSARVDFTSPVVGRFRAMAKFQATKRAAPSESGWAVLRVRD